MHVAGQVAPGVDLQKLSAPPPAANARATLFQQPSPEVLRAQMLRAEAVRVTLKRVATVDDLRTLADLALQIHGSGKQQ